MKTYELSWGGHSLKLGKRTCIMGILNVTPDSFSDGGDFLSKNAAVDHAINMVKSGADIIDVGGESTRPFSDQVSEQEEAKRVIPVIKELAKKVRIPISIDTTKASVAEQAIWAGASMINDVGAMRLDPDMASVVGNFDVPVILMHMKGKPKTMQEKPVYNDLVKDIKKFLKTAIEMADKHNISKSKIIVDPGIGFGKTFDHNFSLLKHIGKFESLDVPILVGPSRKAFIRNLLKENSQKDLKSGMPAVETGTQAAVAAAVLNGAHIVRVHDVASTRATVQIIDAIKTAD